MYGSTSNNGQRFTVTAEISASAPSSAAFRAAVVRELETLATGYRFSANRPTVSVGEVTEAERVLTLTQSELDALVDAECVRRATESATPSA